MISDINLRINGKAGRITLQRPKALNAMTYEMCLAIEHTLVEWKNDSKVELIIIDAQGDKAFCTGGDISDLYEEGRKEDKPQDSQELPKLEKGQSLKLINTETNQHFTYVYNFCYMFSQ